jgi:hypothetical protein
MRPGTIFLRQSLLRFPCQRLANRDSVRFALFCRAANHRGQLRGILSHQKCVWGGQLAPRPITGARKAGQRRAATFATIRCVV